MTDVAPPPKRPQDRILVAIDTPDEARAADLSRRLAGAVGGIKLGLEFFNANGPEGVRRVARAAPEETPRGQAPAQQRLFLDLKFHDIPNTVAGAVRGAMQLGPWMLNVHASGGAAMMTAARQAAEFQADSLGVVRPMLIAVTVLTSLDEDDLAVVGQQGPAADQVARLARLAQECGLDGVVCSAREIAAIRAACGPDFRLIVPGIRPAGAETGDQKRTMTPAEALAAGADYLVIGRPITGAADPAEAARAVAAEMTP
ncbi:MAG: orotidine-5'-phosphate decarboxylase [Marivibrio sp.]|uniref:orotidine-5'-phosphate decarboxylase n=1 Tax=Marivibrio sp. TaxID=2039719 RepID=UPI0032EC7357